MGENLTNVEKWWDWENYNFVLIKDYMLESLVITEFIEV